MLHISVDTKAAHAAVDGMIRKLNHFRRVDIGAELSSWQTQNMHRHRPFTMRSRAKGTATTVIRPHSEFEIEQRERVAKRYERGVRRLLRQLTGKSKRKVRRIPRPIHRTSTRPYLRASLYQMLRTRMANVMQARLKWQ